MLQLPQHDTLSASPINDEILLMSADHLILTLSCANRPGIVSAVSTHLFEIGCNIIEAQQFDDLESGRFFMRVVFNFVETPGDAAAIDEGFAPIAAAFGMDVT